MWRRLSSQIRPLISSRSGSRFIAGCRPTLTQLPRQFTAASENVVKRVEDVVPIATGHEREELEAELQGRNILDINFPEGPFGTKAWHNTPTIFYLAVGGSLLSYIYSAPPLKLKQNGWIGSNTYKWNNFLFSNTYKWNNFLFLGFNSYIQEALCRWAGQALFGTLTPDIIVLTILYSTAGLGIAIVNDFKSVEGDRAMGLQSLPVAFGTEAAKWICVGAIDLTQLSVAGYLLSSGKPYYALALLGLIIPQIFFQFNGKQVYLQSEIDEVRDEWALGITSLIEDGAIYAGYECRAS